MLCRFTILILLLFTFAALPSAQANSPCLGTALLQTASRTHSIRTVRTSYQGRPAFKLELEDGKATLVYSLSEDKKDLHIHLIVVTPEFERQGVSLALFREALERSGDQVEQILGELELDNLKAFQTAYSATPRSLRSSDLPAALRIGVEATPFYSVSEGLGFGDVASAVPYTRGEVTAGIRVRIARTKREASQQDVMADVPRFRPEEFSETTRINHGYIVRELLLTEDRGRLEYHLSPDGKSLTIDYMSTPKELRQKKHSTALAIEALRRAGPQVQEIRAGLQGVNYQFFDQTWKAVPRSIRKSDPKLATQQAVRGTPFFKTFQRLGFSEVFDAEVIEFKVPSLRGEGGGEDTDYEVSIVLRKRRQ